MKSGVKRELDEGNNTRFFFFYNKYKLEKGEFIQQNSFGKKM